jgi:hypothetical protein
MRRKEKGIRTGPVRQPKPTYGRGGCRPCCPGWEECNRSGGQGILPCEVYVYLDEDERLIDNEPVIGGGIALAGMLYLLEEE